MKGNAFNKSFSIISCICLSFIIGYSQTSSYTSETFIPIEQYKQQKDRRNILKSNILSPLSLGYERAIGKHFSISAYGIYFPPFELGNPEDKYGFIALDNGTNGIIGEVKYYISPYKNNLKGFYLGAFYVFRVMDAQVRKIIFRETDFSRSKLDATIYIPAEFRFFGISAGWQRIGKRGFVYGLDSGLGYYKLSNIPDIYPVNNETALGKILNKYKGFMPRLALTLGYAF